jgi:hypothetical protein
MDNPIGRSGGSLAARLAVGLAAGGGVCIVASMLIGFLVADHSSSDSSPSSLITIGLGSIGVLLVILGVLLFAGAGLGGLWRRARQFRHGEADS